MKLTKLLLVGGVVAASIVGAKVITRGVQHAREEVTIMVDWAESKMPLEKRFAMLRKEAAALDKDIDRAKNELAREIVEVRELTRQTDELKAQVEKAAKELVARGDTINDATNNKVSVGRQTISVAEAKSRLQKDVSSHVKVVKRLEVMEKTLAQREQIRDTLQKTLDSLKAKKSEALIAIDELEAEYKELQLTQIESKYQADESRLAKIKETLAKIRKDIEVKKEVLQLTPSVREDAPAEGTATGSQSVEDILAPVKAQR